MSSDSNCILLTLTHKSYQNQTLRTKLDKDFQQIKAAYAAVKGWKLSDINLSLNGVSIRDGATPRSLALRSGALIQVESKSVSHPPSCIVTPEELLLLQHLESKLSRAKDNLSQELSNGAAKMIVSVTTSILDKVRGHFSEQAEPEVVVKCEDRNSLTNDGFVTAVNKALETKIVPMMDQLSKNVEDSHKPPHCQPNANQTQPVSLFVLIHNHDNAPAPQSNTLNTLQRYNLGFLLDKAKSFRLKHASANISIRISYNDPKTMKRLVWKTKKMLTNTPNVTIQASIPKHLLPDMKRLKDHGRGLKASQLIASYQVVHSNNALALRTVSHCEGNGAKDVRWYCVEGEKVVRIRSG